MGKRLIARLIALALAVLQVLHVRTPNGHANRRPTAAPASGPHAPHIEGKPFPDAITERVQAAAHPVDSMPPGRGTDWDWNEPAYDEADWIEAANATPLGMPAVLRELQA